MIWFVGPSSYLYGSIDSTSDDVTITRLSFPEASAAVFPAASLLSAALPAAVVLDAEDPPQPARLAAIAAASATNKALFFIFHILLYLTYFFRQPSSLKDYIEKAGHTSRMHSSLTVFKAPLL